MGSPDVLGPRPAADCCPDGGEPAVFKGPIQLAPVTSARFAPDQTISLSLLTRLRPPCLASYSRASARDRASSSGRVRWWKATPTLIVTPMVTLLGPAPA